MSTWDEAFSHHYDKWSADITADIAFYVDLARSANGPIVELAVGERTRGRPCRDSDRPAGHRG